MNRWLAGHILWPLTERLRRRDTMRRFAEMCRSQHWAPEAIRDLQDRKLRRLLSLAVSHCPFHTERIRHAGIDPEDPRLSLDILADLPTLSRDDIREHREEMTWFGCPRGGPQLYNTGGSSGEPLKFYFDRFRQAADWAARWRARQWWGVGPGDPEILLWGAPIELAVHDRLRQWRDALLNQHLLNAFDMTDATMDAYVDRIRATRPVCLYGYASSLALLSRHALGNGLAPGGLGSDRLRAVFVTGEVLLEPDRQVIASAFGAPVVIEYGCRDGGLLALGCPAGRLHIPQENVVVELLDPDGHPVEAGQTGEVVVTHLETFAMPILRYRTGDLARAWAPDIIERNPREHKDLDLCSCGISQGAPSLTQPRACGAAQQGVGAQGRCECGVSLTALAEVKGRLTDQIVCRDGDTLRRMHALALIYVLREFDGIRQFRITQPSLDCLDIDVVANRLFTPEAERAVTASLRRRVGDDVEVRIRRCEHIPPSPSGKHACVVSHVAS